jgi:hypothetical protein
VAEDVTEEMEWAAREAADKEQDWAMQVTLRIIADMGILRAQADTDMAVVGRETVGRYSHLRLG